MNVFVAGGSGTIGLPLVRALVAAGHQVALLTRSPQKRDELRGLGAAVVVADALDRRALMDAVQRVRPTHVIHQLTALPKDGPRRASDLIATNRLRTEGTRNLLEAAIQVDAKRVIVGSFALLSGGPENGSGEHDESAAAVRSMETQVLDANRSGAIEAVVLRYGLFYGSEVPSTVHMIELIRKRRLPVVRSDRGRLPLINLEDAVTATIRALDKASAGAVYNIVDDEAVSLREVVETIAACSGSANPYHVPGWLPRLVAPAMSKLTARQLPLSNATAKAELVWRLKYPTMREGVAQMFRRAA
jgi:nucleoside-diphosphate-sugar epimerase